MNSMLPIIFSLLFWLWFFSLFTVRSGAAEEESSSRFLTKVGIVFLPRPKRFFLYALEKAVGDEYRIFGKVRLADIVDTGVFRGVGDKAFSLIAYKHIDFLLCDKRDSSIVCAVELDDWTHGSEKRRIKDAEKEYALNSAGVPLVRFLPDSGYALNGIRTKVSDKTGRFAATRILPELFYPKCGADRVARLAKSGIYKGNFFIGCSNYPDCRFIAE